MYTPLDDVRRALVTLRLDSENNLVEDVDVFRERSDRFCRAHQLVHNRQCRRIYRTLCEFCKPEEVVQEPRETTAALCHAWKTIKPACGDAVAELLSRLSNNPCTPQEVPSAVENSAISLILALVDSDNRETTENLSVIERSLQQLHSDLRRERAEALDGSAQRTALRQRQLERAVAAQKAQEVYRKTLEEESLCVAELMRKAEGLRCKAEELRKLQMSSASLHGSSSEEASLYPLGLHSLWRRIESHGEAQANLLVRARGFGRTQSNASAVSLLDRATRLHHDVQAYNEANAVLIGDTRKPSRAADLHNAGLIGTPAPAIAAHSSRLKRRNTKRTTLTAPPTRKLSPPVGIDSKESPSAAFGVRSASSEIASQRPLGSQRRAMAAVPVPCATESVRRGRPPRGGPGAMTTVELSSEMPSAASGRPSRETSPGHVAEATPPPSAPVADQRERERLQLVRSKALLLAQIGKLGRSTKNA